MGGTSTIVLVQPQGVNWLAGQEDITHLANVLPPHGLLMLAAWLGKHGHGSTILDLYAYPRPLPEAAAQILELRPDAVGFSATTTAFPGGYALAEILKRQRPDLPVIFGGVHPTSIWERLLREFPALDMIVVGEGEQTLLALAQNGYRPGPEIKGVAYRENGEIRFAGERAQIQDLDILPYPAYEKLTGFPKAYPLPIFNYPRSPATSFITSRGCPFTCSYCDRSVFRSSFRAHSAAYLVGHLAHLKKTYGIRHVNIYDDNFLLKRARVEEFCTLLIESRVKVSFSCIGRVDALDADLLKLMKKAGCWMISIGIESGDEEVLAPHRAKSNLDGIRETVVLIRAAGIRVKGLFMLGIPGETEASFSRTIAFPVDNKLDDVNLTKFTPFPGAPIHAEIGRHGELEEDWAKMNCIETVFVPAGFTRERLAQLYYDFYKNFYRQPKMLFAYGSMLWKSPDSWRRLLKNLPSFLAARRKLNPEDG